MVCRHFQFLSPDVSEGPQGKRKENVKGSLGIMASNLGAFVDGRHRETRSLQWTGTGLKPLFYQASNNGRNVFGGMANSFVG